MKLTDRQIEIIKRILDLIYRNKRTLVALSCVVVFITTYMLILPALTLDKDEAAEQGGISLETTEEEVTAEEAAGTEQAEAAETATPEEQTGKEETAEVSEPETDSVKHTEKATSDNTQTANNEDPLTFEGDNFTIAVTDEASVLPSGTTIEVQEIAKDDKETKEQYNDLYKDALKALQKEEGTDKVADLGFAKFYDITLLDGKTEVQPNDSVNVTIEYDKALQKELIAENTDNVRIIHFVKDEKTEELKPEILENKKVEVNTDSKDKLTDTTFEAEGFSVYAVVYTVDFEYEDPETGEVYAYSIEGGSSIKLSALAEILGISEKGKGAEFVSEVSEVTFSDPSLIKVTKDDSDWTLKSLKAFNTEESLTITKKDGTVIEVKVTDATGTNDLNTLIGDVRIDNVETSEQGDGVIKVGRNYSMHFSFAEIRDDANKQFDTDGDLVYQIPEGVKLAIPSGTFNMTYAGRTYSGNTFTYDETTNTIRVQFTDAVNSLVAKSADAQFTIDVEGYFTGTKTHFEFGNGINKDFTIDDSHDVSVNKSGSYSSNDNKVHYTVQAKSDGLSQNVIVTDTVTGTALTYDQGSIQISGNSSPYTVTENANGFTVKFDSMADQETAVISYTASVDFSRITGKGTVTQTGNTVEIKADGDDGESDTTDLHNQIDYNPLNKTAGTATGEGNTKTLPWTITVNGQQIKNVSGLTITDTNRSHDVMKYSGNGINVNVMDGDNVVRTISVPWAELGVTDPATATSWSYTLPNTSDDINNTYKYVITYETTVDATGKITDFSVSNGIGDDEGHSGGGSSNIGPGEDAVTFEKKNTGYTAGTSSWEITFNVPTNGLKNAVVTDYFPNIWYGEHLIDGLLGDVVVEGLVGDETYSTDISEESVVITFYKSGEKTDSNRGLNGGDEERTIKVKLTTQNDETWVNSLPGGAHTNAASLNVDGQVLTDRDSSYPRSEGISKIGLYSGTEIIDGREYPVYKYSLRLYGITDESFDESGNLIITDEYDNRLKLYRKNEWFELHVTDLYNGHRSQNEVQISLSDNNKMVFNLNESYFEKENGNYLPTYQIYYYMIVKDADTLTAIQNVSINESDHKVAIHNRATWDLFEDEVTIDYEYPAIDKQLINVNKDTRLAQYKIVINPDKLALNGGEPMELQDTATNLSIDYSTIAIETDPELNEDISYYYRGNTGYYTIPDGTKVTITYSARIIGDGSVTFSNEASMGGFRDSTEQTENMTSSGHGSLTINWVTLYKHENQAMDKPLNGAVYVLTDKNGNPILYPASAKGGKAGKPITFTTGNIDLNQLPDGTSTGTPNIRDGYAWLYLDQEQDGMALHKGVTYYYREYKAPEGYQKSDTVYQFTIADHPDYDEYQYYNGDILRMADREAEGILEVRKSFVGAANLTDTQKKQITFRITGRSTHGDTIPIPYGEDSEGNQLYVNAVEFTYADFESGVFRLDNLDKGTYTVTETNNILGEYNFIETTYKVDGGEEQTDGDRSGTVTIIDKTPHVVEYTNKYEEIPASLNVVKKDETNSISLYGATFQLFKKNGNAYQPVTDNEGLTPDGKFTIDFESREGGVSVTGLKAGDYYIVETKAPADYELDSTPIYFTVANGHVIPAANQNGSNVISFNNDKLSVKNIPQHTYTLEKVNEFHVSMKLYGAKFQIYELNNVTRDSNNKAVYTFGDPIGSELTTDESGTIVIDAKDYTFSADKIYSIKETKAPDGYQLSDKVYSFYVGASAPSMASTLATYNESVVGLYNGPQVSIVPNTPDKMDLSVKKQWYKVGGINKEDGGDMPNASLGIDEIEVQLHQVTTDSHGNVSDKIYPDEDSTFKLTKGGDGNNAYLGYKWTDLPTGLSNNTDNPVTYSYYVTEVVPEGFVATYAIYENGQVRTSSEASDISVDVHSVNKQIEIRNSPKPITLNVKKVWLDDGQNRPNNIHVKVSYINKDGIKYTANSGMLGGKNPEIDLYENNGWAATWETVDPGTNKSDGPYTYVIEENVPNGYTATYETTGDDSSLTTTITNTKTESDKLKVKKVWLNSDGSEMLSEPNIPITIQLQKEEGVETGIDVNIQVINAWNERRTYQYKVQANGSLSISFYHGGSFIESESILDGGTYENDSYSISNIQSPKSVVLKYNDWVNWNDGPRSVSYDVGYPDWSGVITDVTTADNIGGITPDNISVSLNKTNNWMHEWSNLTPPSGKTYRYSVREVSVPDGYDVSYVNNEGISTGIIYVKNTESEYTRVTATKEWENKDGGKISAPQGASVIFTLYEDGKKTNHTVTLDGTVDSYGEANPWVATFEGLQRTKSDGTEIVYTVVETQGYNEYVAEQASVESGGVIINSPNSKDITFTKLWMYNDNVLDWPDDTSITITLHRKIRQDGSDVVDRSFEKTYTISEADLTKTGRLNPNAEQFELTVDNPDTYTFKFSGLAGKGSIGSIEGDFTYYVTEAQVDGFGEPSYGTNQDAAYDNGTITNTQEGSYELPHTGGIGTTIFYIIGSLLVLSSVIYFISRKRIASR